MLMMMEVLMVVVMVWVVERLVLVVMRVVVLTVKLVGRRLAGDLRGHRREVARLRHFGLVRCVRGDVVQRARRLSAQRRWCARAPKGESVPRAHR